MGACVPHIKRPSHDSHHKLQINPTVFLSILLSLYSYMMVIAGSLCRPATGANANFLKDRLRLTCVLRLSLMKGDP